MTDKLNHFDSKGNAIMVDVTEKNVTERKAIAKGKIFVNGETYKRILDGNMTKGDVLGVARIAGIMATKKTSDLIPMCHPLMLTKSQIDFEFNEKEKKMILNFLEKVGVKKFYDFSTRMRNTVSSELLGLHNLMKMVLGGTMRRNSVKFYTDGKVNHGLLLSPLFLIRIYKKLQ